MIPELLLAGFLIASDFPCEQLPPEPPADEAISEGPLGFSGLFEFVYHVVNIDDGRPMVLTTLYRIMQIDTSTDAIYTLEAHPLFTILARKGYADAVWVDHGWGPLDTPRGFCSEMQRSVSEF